MAFTTILVALFTNLFKSRISKKRIYDYSCQKYGVAFGGVEWKGASLFQAAASFFTQSRFFFAKVRAGYRLGSAFLVGVYAPF